MHHWTRLSPALLAAAAATLGAAQQPARLSSFSQVGSLPVVAEHHYRMAGRIRPLFFFWIGRDDVGSARVVWRRDGEERGHELLIGSDPRRAPRQVNRWGYIGEVTRGSETTVVGVMTQSDEQSLSEVEARLARQGGLVFRALRSRVSTQETIAVTETVHAREQYTVRDVAVVLDLLDKEANGATVKQVRLPPGTRPGFLSAVAELLHQGVDTYRRTGAAGIAQARVTIPFVYNVTFYDLRLREARLLPELHLGSQRVAKAVWAACEVRNPSSGQATRFELTFGTDGALAEIPLRIVYQPRWWLQVELVLSDEAGPRDTGLE